MASPRRASVRAPASVVLLNKPFGVLCQFSGGTGRGTLADFIARTDVYPAGRLDADSEGLVVLTADGRLQARIADPRHKLAKTYWVEVEGTPDAGALTRLENGIDLAGFVTAPARVRVIGEPEGLWPRNPPIRFRRAIPTTWLELVITEGKNRQVRRMTAAVGLPTLRLVRSAVGPWNLGGLLPGQWREEPVSERVLSSGASRRPDPRRNPRSGAGS